MTQEQPAPSTTVEEQQKSRLYSEQDIDEIISKVLRRTLPEVQVPTRRKSEKWYNRKVWQFVGAFVSFVAIFVTLVLAILQRDMKRIEITEITNTSLTSVAETIAEDIQLIYKGSPVPGLFLVQLLLANNGNVEIRSMDYEDPIVIVLPPDSTIVDATVIESEPRGIELDMKWEDNQVILPRVLLNPEDRVMIQVLVVHPLDQMLTLQVKGRIAGVSNIYIQDALQPTGIDLGAIDSPWVVVLVISGIVLLAVVLALYFFKDEARSPA